MSSLDVDSVFINVSVRRTIDTILDYVYKITAIPPLNVSNTILTNMLEVCTMETCFKRLEGKLYIQKEFVMGSPFGVLFADALMCNIEPGMFDKRETPNISICPCTRNHQELDNLKHAL